MTAAREARWIGPGIALVVAALAVVALVPAQASAESGRQSDFLLRFTTMSPGSPTGIALHVVLRKPGDPNGKPSPLRSAVVTLPSGFALDSGAVPVCDASDDQMRLLGSNACPSETALAVGDFSAMTGVGPPFDPIAGDNHVFNGPRQLIEIITAPGSSVSPGFDRLTFDGSTVTAHPPMAPGGPPDGETSVRSIGFQIPARTAGSRSLFRAPPECPSSGWWTSTATFGFADGSKDVVSSLTPCKQPAGASTQSTAKRSSIRVAVSPRRVGAGRRVRYVVRVSSTDARCISGAGVRFAGRTMRTDGNGRAALTATLRRPGTRRVQVTAAGCGAGSAVVRVMPARRR